jgi:hypothetical protein
MANFVQNHLDDAKKAAAAIGGGTTAADILALSGYESKWGAGDYIASNGNFTGNAFFSLEAELPTHDSPPPAPLWGSTGWSQPSAQPNYPDNKYVVMAGYASYAAAANSFVHIDGGYFSNVTDAGTFANDAKKAGYGINVVTFQSIVNTLLTRCGVTN